MTQTLSRYEQIEQLSKQLDADPGFQFENFEQAHQVMSYRRAGGIISQRERFPKPKPEPRFWKKFGPGRQPIKPVSQEW
jgi:hypothetical protein